MASEKVQYIVALIAEFAAHYGVSTKEAVQYLQRYKALDLYNRQYDYLHTQPLYIVGEWEVYYDNAISWFKYLILFMDR